jgi:integrase
MSRQKGCIYKSKNGRRWFARYRLGQKMIFCDLAPVNDAYRSKKDVQPLLDEILLPVNAGKVKPESTLTVADYGENYWLPWVRDNCKPSTICGYEQIWKSYLSPRLNKTTLRDFRAGDVYDLLNDLCRELGLGKTVLIHCKNVLSGIFTLAVTRKVLNVHPIYGFNHGQGLKHLIPKNALASRKTHKTKPEQVVALLHAVETTNVEEMEISRQQRLQVQTAIGLMFFAGLRPGEARGVRWEDLEGKRLTLHRSTWRTHTTTTKTDILGDEPKQVPVIEPLSQLLNDMRQADGDPSCGPILRGPSGKPLNLDNLARRVLSPLLKAANIPWHGWYSLRRGIATTLASLTGNLMASKGLLRHTSTKTTERFYVEDVPKDTLEGMNRFAALFSECSTMKQ